LGVPHPNPGTHERKAAAKRDESRPAHVRGALDRAGRTRRTGERPIPGATRAARAVAQRAREEQVRRLWQSRLDRPAIAERLGLTVSQVDKCLKNLRRRRVHLRSQWPVPSPKTAAVEALFRQGLTFREVMARKAAAAPWVYNVRRSMAERGEIDYRPRR
jgi:hypothetical protein